MNGVPSFAQQKQLIKHLARSMDRRELKSFLLSLVEKSGGENGKAQIIDELIRITKLCEVIPDHYSPYRKVVHDGIRFLLAHISQARLINLIVDQILLEDGVTGEERLIAMAREFPTLHKLGQIIARNRHVEASFRKWLIHLESGLHGTRFSKVRRMIAAELGDAMAAYSIVLDDRILAEASVGVVVPFTWQEPESGRTARGVFKLLKSRVKERLGEELRLLDEVALYFEGHKQNYSVKDFRFIETFRDIKEALQKEIDLAGEQANLKAAFRAYAHLSLLRIPRVLPFSTTNITAMELINGCKVTDAPVDSAEKRACAERVFNAVVGYPLFSLAERSLFHGDPHAGNIYAVAAETGEMAAALLDWSMAGHLSKAQRLNLLRLILAVITEDEAGIFAAVRDVSDDNLGEEPLLAEKARRIIHDIIGSRSFDDGRLAEKTFAFIDQLGIRGIRFPANFLLFRKAVFTLEGVLCDLDPGFDMDAYMIRFLAGLLVEELPQRWMGLLFPLCDRAEHYKSLLSNTDLQRLFYHRVMDGFKKSADMFCRFMGKNAVFWTKLSAGGL